MDMIIVLYYAFPINGGLQIMSLAEDHVLRKKGRTWPEHCATAFAKVSIGLDLAGIADLK